MERPFGLEEGITLGAGCCGAGRGSLAMWDRTSESTACRPRPLDISNCKFSMVFACKVMALQIHDDVYGVDTAHGAKREQMVCQKLSK